MPEMNLRPGRHSVEVVQPKNEMALIAATIVVDQARAQHPCLRPGVATANTAPRA